MLALFDPTVGTIAGTIVTTIGLIVVAWIQLRSKKDVAADVHAVHKEISPGNGSSAGELLSSMATNQRLTATRIEALQTQVDLMQMQLNRIEAKE